MNAKGMCIASRWPLVGIVLIVGAIVMRMTAPAINLPWFDVDPSTVDHAALGLLPGCRFLLDALMLIGAAIIFISGATRGRTTSWLLLLLAVVPMPILWWHAWNDPADLEQASMWMAAVLSAIALSQVAVDQEARGLGLALLLAALGPVLIQAVFQVAWEIPATIAFFEANRSEVFAMRGVEPASSAAQVFERRLRGASPTAWFASPNLLGSVMAAGASVWLAITIATIKAKWVSGLSGLAGLLTLAMAVLVFASHSTGAIMVLGIGFMVVITGYLIPHAWRPRLGWMGLFLIMAALISVPASSLLGDLPGVRSLVIRSGYVAGASEMLLEAPWTGVGPADFQDQWLQVRGAESPEEIVSPHSMPWDWVTAMGLAGLAWFALALAGLLWAGSRLQSTSGEESDAEEQALPRRTIVGASVLICLGMIWSQWHDLMHLGSDVGFTRVLGWLTYVGLSILFASCWRLGFGIALGAFAAVVVLLVHAQLEMSIEQSMTAPFILALLGLSAPAGLRSSRASAGWAAWAISGGLAVAVIEKGLYPSWQADDRIKQIGEEVHLSTKEGDGASLLETRRQAAVSLLESASDRNDDRLRQVAAAQLIAGIVLSESRDRPPAPRQLVEARDEAIVIASDLFERSRSVEAGQMLVSILAGSGDSDDLDQAVLIAEEVASLDPVGLWSQRHLADLLWESGEEEVARVIYERVLQLDEARVIDPLRQLSPQDRKLIQSRLD
ncbi:MAG: O-antigen ligase family protein [Phycisphaerales bacterium]|nr:O-antigen ligase family protein [Phycisphaerales bacterium]